MKDPCSLLLCSLVLGLWSSCFRKTIYKSKGGCSLHYRRAVVKFLYINITMFLKDAVQSTWVPYNCNMMSFCVAENVVYMDTVNICRGHVVYMDTVNLCSGQCDVQ